MKSIMQPKDGTCYLCMKLHNDYSQKVTEEHHVIYGSRHKLSERYGLKVYLCSQHHRTGKEAVHFNADISKMLKDAAQRAFEHHFPGLDFFAIFGKNYKIDDDQENKKRDESFDGFISLGGNDNGDDGNRDN